MTRPVAFLLAVAVLVAGGVVALALVRAQPSGPQLPAAGTAAQRSARPADATAPAGAPGTPSAAAEASASPTPTQREPLETPEPVAILVGAGDIADCGSTADEATADLLDAIRGTVFTLGDNAYPSGTTDQFLSCYGPSWGRHLERTSPSAGNHDYETPGAAGYFAYFGDAAGLAGEGWYSYDAGGWHVIVLNSICDAVGGCHAGSPQEAWLRADLAANQVTCTLAYWHNPRFSSGATHGSDATYDAFWRALYDAGADLVLAGHDHVYERFAPQDPDGRVDPARGIRQFTVGTGGRSLYGFGAELPATESRSNQSFGVLRLTLRTIRYDWEFIPVAGGTFSDAGSGACH